MFIFPCFSMFFLTCFTFAETRSLMSVSQDLRIILSCNSTSPVDKRSLNLILVEKRFHGNVNENFKCFLHCLYQEYRWMDNDGAFQYDEMRITLFESNLTESSIEYLLTTCTETDAKSKCERAYFFTECFWSEGEKLEQKDLSEMEEFC